MLSKYALGWSADSRLAWRVFVPRYRHAVIFKPFPKQCMTDLALEKQKDCRTWQARAWFLAGLF